jgi:hypothetical protein
MALTPKQQRFVEEYAVDCCATAAARRAGYSDRTAAQIGYQLLQKPSVQEAARKTMAERAGRAEITADWVLQRLLDEATRQGEGSSAAARVRALHLLGLHFGLFARRVEVSGPNARPIRVTRGLSDAELEAILAASDSRTGA